MRTVRQIQRRGFTLLETVVTVGIVAALAAVVYPTVVRQFDTTDPMRVVQDLNTVGTGVETFGVNLNPKQPKDIEDLANKPINTDLNALGVAYSLPTDTSNWFGPYISASILAAAATNAGVITTGFGATLHNTMPLFDVDDADPVGGDSIPDRTDATDQAAADFVAIRIDGLTGEQFKKVNDLIDGDAENTVLLRRNSGRFRCPYAAASAPTTDSDACTVAYFLAAPLRK